MSDISTYDHVIGWLKSHSGKQVFLEIGQQDPDRDAYPAIFGQIYNLRLGEVALGTDEGELGADDERTVWIVSLPDFGQKSKLIFDRRHFVSARGHDGAFKVRLRDTYYAFADE